jgi:hypothetical protein
MGAPAADYSIEIYEMMARLGIEPGNGALPQFSLRYATALSRCEDCQCKKACRDWFRLRTSDGKFCASLL